MIEFIELTKQIDWFSNCGRPYDISLYYKYITINEKDDAIKQLKKERNLKGFTSLTNLLIEANRRLGLYLDKYAKKEAQYTFNSLADTINKRFMNNSHEVDFMKIDKHFSQEFSTENKRWVYRIFRSTMTELYFLDYLPNIPTFYTKIFQIFQDSHVVTGWEGKFPSHETTFLNTPILSADGKVFIY